MTEGTINGSTLGALQVTQAEVQLTNTGLDTFTFRQEGTPTFSQGESVVVAGGGSTLFGGTVRQVQLFGSAGKSGASYVCANAWPDLERLVYHQTFGEITANEGTITPRTISKIFLYQDDAGAALTNIGQLGAILDYAVAQSVTGFIKGSISLPAVTLPMTEVRDATVAELLQMVLAPTPEAGIYWTYSGSSGTLNILDRDGMANVARAPDSAANCSSYNLTEITDQKPSGVVIHWEKPISYNGQPHLAYETQQSGSGPEGVGVQVHTLPVAGAHISTTHEELTTMLLPQVGDEQDNANGGSDASRAKVLNMLKWLFPDAFDHDELLVSSGSANLAFDNYTLVLADPPIDAPLDGADDFRNVSAPGYADPNLALVPGADPDADPETTAIGLPRFLIDGAEQDWMSSSLDFAPVNGAIDVFAKGSVPTGLADFLETVGLVKFPGDADVGAYVKARVTFQVIGTNARSKVYRQVESADAGGQPIDDLDEQLLGQWGANEWRGNAVFHGFDGALTPGKTFSLAGVSSAAMIQGAKFDLAGLSTTVEVGPADRLGPQDFVDRQLLQSRAPVTWRQGEERTQSRVTSGAGGGGGGKHLPVHMANKLGKPDPPYPLKIEPGEGGVWVQFGVVGGDLTTGDEIPQIGGVDIGTNPAPILTVTETDDWEVIYGKVTFQAVFTGSGPAIVTGAVLVGAVELLAAAALPAGQKLTVSTSGTGTTTQNGIYYFILGRAKVTDGSIEVETPQGRRGPIGLTFCGDTMSLVFVDPYAVNLTVQVGELL